MGKEHLRPLEQPERALLEGAGTVPTRFWGNPREGSVQDRLEERGEGAAGPIAEASKGAPGQPFRGSGPKPDCGSSRLTCRLWSFRFPQRSRGLEGWSSFLRNAGSDAPDGCHTKQHPAAVGPPRGRATRGAGPGPGWCGAQTGSRARFARRDRPRAFFAASRRGSCGQGNWFSLWTLKDNVPSRSVQQATPEASRDRPQPVRVAATKEVEPSRHLFGSHLPHKP
jgi:hypothetical protein